MLQRGRGGETVGNCVRVGKGIDFNGLGEVTTNLYTMYVYDKVLHKGLYNHENIPGKQAVIDGIKKYMSGKPDFDKFCNDPFLALTMYIEIIEISDGSPSSRCLKNTGRCQKNNIRQLKRIKEIIGSPVSAPPPVQTYPPSLISGEYPLPKKQEHR